MNKEAEAWMTKYGQECGTSSFLAGLVYDAKVDCQRCRGRQGSTLVGPRPRRAWVCASCLDLADDRILTFCSAPEVAGECQHDE